MLEFTNKYGYKDIELLLSDIDEVLILFFDECWCENKIEEADNLDFKNYRYQLAG